jgi:sirohydrochlorin ferrochelatase
VEGPQQEAWHQDLAATLEMELPSGLFPAYHTALQHAQGIVLSLLGDEDVSAPQRAQALQQALEELVASWPQEDRDAYYAAKARAPERLKAEIAAWEERAEASRKAMAEADARASDSDEDAEL